MTGPPVASPPPAPNERSALAATRWAPAALMSAGVVAFTVLWTWVGWLQYQTLHLSVYDFGLIYQEIWASANGQSVLQLGAGAVHPLVLGFVPIYAVIPTQASFFLFLLMVNSAAIALGAVPIYLIVRDAYRNTWLAAALALAYLAFPAVAGSLWFPVHLESLFPVLFLTGYWLYRRDRWGWACVPWTFAMVTNVGAPIILAAFAVGMVAEPLLFRSGWWERLRGRPRPPREAIPRRRLFLAGYLLASSAVVFVGISIALIAYDGSQGFTNFLLQAQAARITSAGGGTNGGALGVLGRQTLTIALLFVPLLGLPFLGREERWAMVPFLAHVLVVGSPQPFLWPFKDQYFCYILPGLFASALRGLERPWVLRRAAVGEEPAQSSLERPRWFRHRSPALRWGLGSVVAVVLVGIVFAPWGPANPALGSAPGLAQGYYNFPAATTADPSGVQAVRSLVAVTPSSGTLLVQNNIVEPLNRFQYVVPGYHTVNQSVSYVLSDPYDHTFYDANQFGPYPASMLRWANYYLATGASVLGEAGGAVLLSINHTASAPVYHPLAQSFGPAAFSCCGTERLSNVSTAATLISGPTLPFQGNYSVWSPGNFTMTVELGVTQSIATDRIALQLSYDGGLVPIANFAIWGGNASPSGVLTASFSLHVPVYLPGLHWTLVVDRWGGSVWFDRAWLNQTAPVATERVGPPWSTSPQVGRGSAGVPRAGLTSNVLRESRGLVPWAIPVGFGIVVAVVSRGGNRLQKE